jgi:lipoprotein NlpI
VLERGPPVRRAEAFHNRGIAYRAKGDIDKAISDVNEGIRIDPRRAYRFQERGELYFEKGDFGQAITDFNEAIRLDSTRAFRFHWRGLAYSAIGNFPLAIANFTEAIRIDPVPHSFRFYDRANAYRASAQYDSALTDYDEVLQLDATNGWAFVDRGRTYSKTGRIASAKSDFEAALRVPDVSPELRQAVAEEMTALNPTPPVSPTAPLPESGANRLSALGSVSKIIEQKLPSIRSSELRKQADEVLAKLATAKLDMTPEELDRLGRLGDEIVKRLNQIEEFDRVSSIASRQVGRIKEDIQNVVTDASYLEEIQGAIAAVERSQQLGSLAELQVALGNLARIYDRYRTQIERDRFSIP